MKCEYCGRERSWGGVVCCEKEAEGWANMALKRAPMTEQEELQDILSVLKLAGPIGAAQEILLLRRQIVKLERQLDAIRADEKCNACGCYGGELCACCQCHGTIWR